MPWVLRAMGQMGGVFAGLPNSHAGGEFQKQFGREGAAAKAIVVIMQLLITLAGKCRSLAP
eukprot:377317-Amphidinium_carterae.1